MPNKEPLFRFVLNHSQELIIRYDSYGFINYVNQKAMDTLGYTGEELQGLYIGELLKGVYCMVDNHVAFADQSRDKEEIETVIYRKNQTCFPVVMTSTSIIYEGEVAFFCMLMDMTNYKESIRKLDAGCVAAVPTYPLTSKSHPTSAVPIPPPILMPREVQEYIVPSTRFPCVR